MPAIDQISQALSRAIARTAEARDLQDSNIRSVVGDVIAEVDRRFRAAFEAGELLNLETVLDDTELVDAEHRAAVRSAIIGALRYTARGELAVREIALKREARARAFLQDPQFELKPYEIDVLAKGVRMTFLRQLEDPTRDIVDTTHLLTSWPSRIRDKRERLMVPLLKASGLWQELA